ncbi:TPA: LL-diaminopimelate aminotransferase [Candidatus Woesearchaeota archaeon]|nr:LL-diaminopimelate aminotransferase [Candidatus Woesearchaeota archaeon]
MAKRNPHLAKLQSGYLFPEINRRKKEFLAAHPQAKLISLGIGDTTQPIAPPIIKGIVQAVKRLGKRDTYTGYGDEQGITELRERIASVLYHGRVKGEEVFVSDGAKPDTGRLQMLFGSDTVMAVQDPSYPVYVDSSVMMGQTGPLSSKTSQFKGIAYLPCTPDNGFFPSLGNAKDAGVIFFCSPNNPTGAVATREQLKALVDFAKENRSIIIFDAAYSQFIRDENLPRSIYEIPGAKEVALEVSSFSKSIGFTGVRLGWTVVPNELCFDDGTPVRKDWNRIMTTVFNGASSIAQYGGIAALEREGMKEMERTVSYYMENASIIRQALRKLGYTVFGGDNAPYLWVQTKGMTSWDAFSFLLQKAHVITTPGSGFGPSGEGFLRFSAFGHREDVLEAVKRLEKIL